MIASVLGTERSLAALSMALPFPLSRTQPLSAFLQDPPLSSLLGASSLCPNFKANRDVEGALFVVRGAKGIRVFILQCVEEKERKRKALFPFSISYLYFYFKVNF